jgi:hypothetical protein
MLSLRNIIRGIKSLIMAYAILKDEQAKWWCIDCNVSVYSDVFLIYVP